MGTAMEIQMVQMEIRAQAAATRTTTMTVEVVIGKSLFIVPREDDQKTQLT